MQSATANKIDNDWVVKKIQHFIDSHPDNRFPFYDAPIWKTPLVGFSSGADELYKLYKEDIGDFYQTPIEVFRAAFPEESVSPEDLSVICWALPQSDYTREQNRLQKEVPSLPWAYSRFFGDELNKSLCRYLLEELSQRGIHAASPYLNNPNWQKLISEKYGESGTWSERHAAYISGLGTFSLTDAVITSAGISVRFGSLIAKLPLDATRRPYTKYNEYCLQCGACIKRCPAHALSMDGHNKWKCKAYTRGTCKPYSAEHYDIDFHSCGLCQTGVPCERAIPAAHKSVN